MEFIAIVIQFFFFVWFCKCLNAIRRSLRDLVEIQAKMLPPAKPEKPGMLSGIKLTE